SAGHARTLLGLPDPASQIKAGKEVISGGLSVRATEALVRERRNEPAERSERTPPIEKSSHLMGIEDELRKKLATRVEIKLKGKERGQMVLKLGNNDDFERLMEVLRK